MFCFLEKLSRVQGSGGPTLFLFLFISNTTHHNRDKPVCSLRWGEAQTHFVNLLSFWHAKFHTYIVSCTDLAPVPNLPLCSRYGHYSNPSCSASGVLHGVPGLGEDLRTGSQGSQEVCWNKQLWAVLYIHRLSQYSLCMSLMGMRTPITWFTHQVTWKWKGCIIHWRSNRV